jgi:hypothetical protein
MQMPLKNTNKSVTIAAFTAIVFLTPLLTQLAKSNLMKLFEDLAYLVMLLISIHMLSRNKDITLKISKTVMIFVLAFLLFATIGLYYSGVSMVILQFREYKYLLLLIIILPFNKIEDFKYVWPIFKVIALVCVPVSIAQWFVYRTEGDFITGIMGFKESGTLTMFLLIIFFTEFMLRLKNNHKIFGYYFLFLIPTALNETKITLFLLPLMFFTSLYFSNKLRLKYVVNTLLIIGILIGGWITIYNKTGTSAGGENFYQDSVLSIFSTEFIEEYLFASDWEGDAGRMTKVLLAVDIIQPQPFFGYGLGASYGGVTSGINGYAFKDYSSGEQLGGSRPQLVLSLIDLGIAGTMIVLIILISIFRKIVRLKGLSVEKALAINSLLIILLTFAYGDIFYTKRIMFIFLVFTLLAVRFQKKQVKR